MTDITQLHQTELLRFIQDLQKEIQQGRITYIEMVVQREDDEYVEWDLLESGIKSLDHQHLLAQVGCLYMAAHDVVNEILEIEDED